MDSAFAVLADAAIAGSYAGDGVAVEENLGGREAREEVDAFGFHEPGEPPGEPVERDHVVAVVHERRRCNGKLDLAGPGQKVDRFVMDFRGERRAALLEVRDEIAEARRIEDGAGQHVRAGFAPFFKHGDRERVAALRLLQLRQPQRGREPRGTSADDQDIDF